MSTLEDVGKRIREGVALHPKTIDKYIGYGTAGFRDKAEVLDHVMFRVGIIALLRSKLKQATIGVMITASHNPEGDNGVKLVDPAGEMLEQEWEVLATKIANVDDAELPECIMNLINKYKIDLIAGGSVFLGQDTRESSPSLAGAVTDGFNTVAVADVLEDFGLVTTPMLHYLVVSKNANEEYTKDGYYQKLVTAYTKLIGDESKVRNYEPLVVVDCANGVGAIAVKELQHRIDDKVLYLHRYNDGPPGILNFECGADYVKVHQQPPKTLLACPERRCASLDGDADRLIYSYFDRELKFHLLDGDKISLLFAEHLGYLVKKANLNLKLGIVQTAYANGASTNYAVEVLGLPVACVATGVKHLHHAALAFDIGVYFEANGHGTVVFSNSAITLIKEQATSGDNKGAVELEGFLNLINSTVGDAISDMFVVEAILHAKGWNAEQWNSMYTDLPNRQLKVSVCDREVIKTEDAERKCVSPNGLQIRIDSLVSKYPDGRSFVRPSGTEDIVRVYSEADTQANADALGAEVALAVYEVAGGVGPKPCKP